MTTPRACANALRMLAVDTVQQANSGHPGAPMGMADTAEAPWQRHLRHNPDNPRWPDGDRFVLSNGHASMPLYALLHLSGYDLPLTELQRLRQLLSRTPGHPEYGETPGVETTTGPLGQGLANAVGMALAGTLGLGKLIGFCDDNGISIDGDVRGWFGDDTPRRFEACGWQVVAGVDGHDADAIDRAIRIARDDRVRPTLICCKTTIGNGSPNRAGSETVHGVTLGADEIAATRRNLDWPHPAFVLPEEIERAWDARWRAVHVLTHDSIGLGEDGPTHQPVERAASLRLIPNLDVWRPCDGIETAAARIAAIERNGDEAGPSCLLLSRLPGGDVAVEAGATSGWHEYVGRNGTVIGLDRFGITVDALLGAVVRVAQGR